LGGYAVLSENHDGEDNDIDIELLFNAVVAKNEKVKTLFNDGVTA
jgi:hypothetical protein